MSNRTRLHTTACSAALAALAGILLLAPLGCRSKTGQAQTASGGDPAAANMAPPYTGGDNSGQTSGSTQVLGQNGSYSPQSSGESYETQTPAPIIRQAPAGSAPTQYYPVPQAGNGNASYQDGSPAQPYPDGSPQGSYPDPNASNGTYNDAEEAGEQALAETDQPPPPLPEYDQPAAPEDNYLWTPGYWNYASAGYYWVPGVWCAPPFIGALWTPPYWGAYNHHYLFHRGYWGSHVGYYGGVNYGFGYIGTGYFGGYWNHRDFYYNRAVTNVNVNRIHNVYNRSVVYDNRTYGPHPENRVSYNGGRGGLTDQPRPQELAAMREDHYAPVAAQRDNRLAAAGNHAQFFHINDGRPAQVFAARALGNVNNIPAAPRERAFNANRVNNPTQPGFNNNRVNNPTQPGFNNNNRANNPTQPGFNNNRVNNPTQPGFNNNNRANNPTQPGFNNNRANNPTQPGFNNNRANTPTQPGINNNRPNNLNQPGINNNRPNNSSQPGFNNNRPNTLNQPGLNNNRPNPPAVNTNRPGEFHRDANANPGIVNRPVTPSPQPATPPNRPEGNFNRPGTPAQAPPSNQPGAGTPRPQEFHRLAPAPQPANPAGGGGRPEGFHPQFTPPTAVSPQPRNINEGARQASPQFQRPTPAPQAAPRPQVSAPRNPAPTSAPAPHAEGGDHGHH